jgi:hypothetical protein
MLLVAERVARSIMAAPMASPAPVMIGSRCLSQPVDRQQVADRLVGQCEV